MAKKSLISRRSFLKKTALLNMALFLDACGGGAISTASPGSSGTGSPNNGASSNTLYDGVIQVGTGTNSKRFVNGRGEVIQLRGGNFSGLENTAPQGWSPLDPWGDDGGPPDWAAYATWKPNIARIPLCTASWLGLTCGITTGAEGSPTWASTRSADPGNNYHQTVLDAVAAAQAIGCYVIIDLHWTAPSITLAGVTNYLMPLGQSSFADVDMAIPFWQSIAETFGTQASPAAAGINNNAILFELFNEPYLNQDGGTITTTQSGTITRTADEALLLGGWSEYVINNTQEGVNYKIYQQWEIAGYQQMLDTIRATGAQNICIINGNFYTQDLTGYQTYMPTDTLNQIAFGWHPYPQGNYPYTASPYYYPLCGQYQYSGGAASPTAVDPANAVLAAGYPVICTEDGGFCGTDATSGEPHIQFMMNWADSSGASYLVWQWNSTRPYGTTTETDYCCVFAADGVTVLPIQGQGQLVYDWMVNHS